MRGTIRHRNGAWRLQVYAGRDERTGKRKQVTRTVRAPDTRAGRKTAEAELARLVLEVEAGRHRLDHDTTLAELLEQWVAARSIDWSPATTYQYRWAIEQRIVPHLGALPVHRLRAHDLNTLYAKLRRTGGRDDGPLASGTVQKVHVILHSALAYAVRSDLIAINPADAAEKQTVVEADIAPPTAEQLSRALTEAADIGPLTLAYVLIAAATGARRGQVVALRWPDIDLDAGGRGRGCRAPSWTRRSGGRTRRAGRRAPRRSRFGSRGRCRARRRGLRRRRRAGRPSRRWGVPCGRPYRRHKLRLCVPMS